jgi:hypothetical protein
LQNHEVEVNEKKGSQLENLTSRIASLGNRRRVNSVNSEEFVDRPIDRYFCQEISGAMSDIDWKSHKYDLRLWSSRKRERISFNV